MEGFKAPDTTDWDFSEMAELHMWTLRNGFHRPMDIILCGETGAWPEVTQKAWMEPTAVTFVREDGRIVEVVLEPHHRREVGELLRKVIPREISYLRMLQGGLIRKPAADALRAWMAQKGLEAREKA
jgi:hypothetical protein